jgi:hypothetical protein
VTVNKDELKIKDYNRYHSYYCGLCRSLQLRHGKKGQVTLSYDMVFLDILLNGLYETPLTYEKRSCMLHPLQKHEMVFNELTDYTADMGLLLTYFKLLDNWKDEKDMKSRGFARSLMKDIVGIDVKWPRQSRAVRTCIHQLNGYEATGEYDLDKVSGLTGTMLGELFVYKEGDWSNELRKMGLYLGKFIYLLDAFEDLDKDLKKKDYNPWKPIMDRKDFDATVENTLTMMMADCAKEFEKLPIVQDVEILRNILYSGVWTKYALARKKRDEKKGESDGR